MTTTSPRCFVSVDWMNVEGRLTAFYSKDPVLQAELDGELKGEPKVHARNAAMLYEIDVALAKTHLVNLQGQMVSAYDGGKRIGHLFNYGGTDKKMNQTFWIGMDKATKFYRLLSDKYQLVVKWRQELANDVYGVLLYGCARCGYQQEHDNTDCPNCAASGCPYPVPLKYVGMAQPAKRIHYTNFLRRRLYLGRRKEGMNALASQDPQSTGASMWNITLSRLHGYDPITDDVWPHPAGILRYDPRSPLSHLFNPAEIFVATGHYDSFYLETPVSRKDEVLDWVMWTMEQPWPELGGTRFPGEGSWGYNLGKYDEKKNPFGLQEVHGAPFTRTFQR